jgi:hypothetical protein
MKYVARKFGFPKRDSGRCIPPKNWYSSEKNNTAETKSEILKNHFQCFSSKHRHNNTKKILRKINDSIPSPLDPSPQNAILLSNAKNRAEIQIDRIVRILNRKVLFLNRVFIRPRMSVTNELSETRSKENKRKETRVASRRNKFLVLIKGDRTPASANSGTTAVRRSTIEMAFFI